MSTLRCRTAATRAVGSILSRSSAKIISSTSYRAFSAASSAAAKVEKGLASELQFEKENYKKSDALEKLPTDWKFTDTPGDVNLKLEKDLGAGKKCVIEWQLVSPYDPEMDGMDPEGKEGEDSAAAPSVDETDFTVTFSQSVEGAEEKGFTLYCNTQAGEGHRFVCGNVKCYDSVKERDSPSAYSGPDFEDLEETLQGSLDEYLAEIGVSDEIYDFIDAAAMDKELREYMRWLENLQTFMKN